MFIIRFFYKSVIVMVTSAALSFVMNFEALILKVID